MSERPWGKNINFFPLYLGGSFRGPKFLMHMLDLILRTHFLGVWPKKFVVGSFEAFVSVNKDFLNFCFFKL
jgi:hypothetical protein